VKKKQEHSSISSEILQSFSLLFQNVRVLELYLLQTLKSNEWMAWWQEQENGVKFQQHNSSSKKDGQMRRGGVFLIALEAKRGQFDACQVLIQGRE
jgi:hypothetical protein